jgi:hypothetical protein
MSGVRIIEGWTRWSRDVGTGYSYSRGSVRADMAPRVSPTTGLIEWQAVVWRGADREDLIAEVAAPTHWQCADAFARLPLQA